MLEKRLVVKIHKRKLYTVAADASMLIDFRKDGYEGSRLWNRTTKNVGFNSQPSY